MDISPPTPSPRSHPPDPAETSPRLVARLRPAVKWLTASCLAAMAWCAFCVAGLQMDLSYTEDWYYDLSDDQQRAVYSGILKRIAIIVGPLVATNVAVVLMVVAALRRATRLTSRR